MSTLTMLAVCVSNWSLIEMVAPVTWSRTLTPTTPTAPPRCDPRMNASTDAGTAARTASARSRPNAAGTTGGADAGPTTGATGGADAGPTTGVGTVAASARSPLAQPVRAVRAVMLTTRPAAST